MLRVCRANGWRVEADWFALSEREQIEWLAFDRWRMNTIETLLDAMRRMEQADPAAYVAALIAQL